MKKLKNRIELARFFAESGFTIGVEVGTFDGHYAEVLFQHIPGLQLVCVDPWAVYDGYRDHKFESSMRKAENMARERLAKYDCKILKEFSVIAVNDFADNSLDFVYIDGNHQYEYVKQDISIWTPKVKVGGVVAGHDYYKTPSGNVGVIKAVDEYVWTNGYELQLTDWDKETDIEHDDRQPNWYFEK